MPASEDEILPPPSQPVLDLDRTLGGNKAFHNFYNDFSHVSDPNLRRRLALNEIDKIPFGLYRGSPGQPMLWACLVVADM